MTHVLEEIQLPWLDQPSDGDYAGAQNYLTLLVSSTLAGHAVESMRIGEGSTFRINDLFRAANRNPIPLEDPGVIQTLRKVLCGHQLAPLLIVTYTGKAEIDIADGDHRGSLAYHVNPFMYVPCRQVEINL